jgi:hypothetical protein
MKCFERLVQSNFLTNVQNELQLARQTLEQDRQVEHGFKVYSGDKRIKRIVYNKCVKQFGLIESMEQALQENTQLLFYISIDHLIFAFSTLKSQIDDAIRHSYNLSGDFPLHRGRHRINGVTFHTVLIDTRFSFPPASPN